MTDPLRQERLERLLAEAVLAVEPVKIEGGSDARRRWLGLVLGVQVALLKGGLSGDVYSRVLRGD